MSSVFCFFDELFSAAVPRRGNRRTAAAQEEMLLLQCTPSRAVFVSLGIVIFAPAKSSFGFSDTPQSLLKHCAKHTEACTQKLMPTESEIPHNRSAGRGNPLKAEEYPREQIGQQQEG